MRKILFVLLMLMPANVLVGHHYKGLPHYSYFENYPEIPLLEFVERTDRYEIFITVYNFQGLNLDEVSSPDVVRFYSYIYDIKNDKAFLGEVEFTVEHGDKAVYVSEKILPEQESIYVFQKNITQDGQFYFSANFYDENGQLTGIRLPIKITESFF
jgi:hypothetical protein